MKKYRHREEGYTVEAGKPSATITDRYVVYGYRLGSGHVFDTVIAASDFHKLFGPVRNQPQEKASSAHDFRTKLREHRLDDWQQLSPDPTFVPDRVDHIYQAVDWLLAQVEKEEK